MNILNSISARLSKQSLAFSPAQRTVVERAYQNFAREYPRWAESLFDLIFLNGRAAPILKGYLEGTVHDAGTKIAQAYLEEIQVAANLRNEAMNSVLPVATYFLQQLSGSIRNPTIPTILVTRQA